MESESGNDPSIPSSIEEGVNFHVEGAYIAYEHYHPLLQRAVQALGVSPDLIATVDETSTVLQAEQCVRPAKSQQGPLISRNGPIKQMYRSVVNDREGGERVAWVDTDEYGRQAPGYYVTIPLGSRANADLFPGHTYPMTIKFYQSRETLSFDDEEPMAHPKLCARYLHGKGHKRVPATQDGLAQLQREQEEKILSLLKTAGFPLRPGLGYYVEDAYFKPEESERDRQVRELDLAEIENEQESIVVRYLQNGLSPVEREALEELVNNGAEVSPRDIADRTGHHVESVRRALRRIPGLVERSYGSIALRSRNVAKLVHEGLVSANNRLRKDPTDSSDKAERASEENESALFLWLEKHGIDVVNRESDGSLVLDFGSETRTVSQVRRLLREGLERWIAAGRPENDYRIATYRYRQEPQYSANYISGPEAQ